MSSRPVFEIRRGLIKVRVWRKKAKGQRNFVVTITRLFRNGDSWKESTRYGGDDIPLIRLLLDQAHTWIYEQSQATRT